MNSAIIIAAITLLASTAAVAQAERGERDPDKMAAIAATIGCTEAVTLARQPPDHAVHEQQRHSDQRQQT
jgi:hypothetical protein